MADAKDKPLYEQLFVAAKRGEWYNNYICYGENRSNLQIFVKSLTDLLIPASEREFAVSRHDMRETSIQEAIMDAETMSFVSPRKLVIVEHALFFTALDKKVDAGEAADDVDSADDDSGETDSERQSASEESGERKQSRRNNWTKVEHDLKMLADYLKHPAEFSIVVFLIPGQKLDERKKLVSDIKKLKPTDKHHAVLVPFDKLSTEQLKAWLRKVSHKAGLQFAADADDYFIHINGSDQMILRSELDKLILHFGTVQTVTREMIESVSVRTFEETVFKLIEMIVQKRVARAHELLMELLKNTKENNPFFILSLLARQFRMLLMVKELDREGHPLSQIAATIGAPPFAVKALVPNAKRVEAKQLAAILAECAELDFAFKSGRVTDQKLALEIFVLKLAG